MKTICTLILISGIILSACSDRKVSYPDTLNQLHENAWNFILDVPLDEENVALLLETLSEEGTWPGIDYASKTRGRWSTRNHLMNLYEITRAYQTKGSAFYHKKAVSEKVHLALNQWLDNDYLNPNWWHPEIGTPREMGPVLVLMEAELSPEQLEKGLRILERSRMGMTGQNKVWLAGNVVIRSLLKRNSDTIEIARDQIQEELIVSLKEGIQPDWSYHQHGPQIQFGNYGLSYVNDMIKWISIFRNTPFQMDEEKVSILRNYVLHGQQWITWKDQMDISACGRQLFTDSPEIKAASLSTHFTKMETVDPENADAYQRAGQYQSLSGHKHFWRSDFQVYRNPRFYFSVKMVSERVIGAETVNSENMQGFHTADGATYLYQSGEEYRNIFPFWDWRKIPGTTTMQKDEPLPPISRRSYMIESDFVGGLSDGDQGLAVLDYSRLGLKARKSWFMFNDLIVCLGAGISSREGLPVTTSINQVFLNGDISVRNDDQVSNVTGSERMMNADWILHDQTGYMFPEGGKLEMQAEETDGSWHWVARRYPEEIIKADLFKLWMNHGVDPKNGSYVYIILPGAGKGQLDALTDNLPFRYTNTRKLQAVYTEDQSAAGVIFYEAGSFGSNPEITVDQPCIVMFMPVGQGMKLTIADPTQKLEKIGLTLDGGYQHENANIEDGRTTLSIPLPQQGEAGKSISLDLAKN